MKNIKKNYSNLINHLIVNPNNYSEEDMVVFTPGRGTDYKGDFMIIGRAVNDWKTSFNKLALNNTQELLTEIDIELKGSNLDWVVDNWGKNEGEYNPKKSQFWRVTKELASVIIQNKNDVINSIVYTNLYKVAKEGGGNPSENLCDTQFDICSEILKNEIDYFKPKVVVFLTGLNWAEPFLENMDIKNLIVEKGKFVHFTGKYGSSKIVVGLHPQGKPEEEHLIEILSCLNNLKD